MNLMKTLHDVWRVFLWILCSPTFHHHFHHIASRNYYQWLDIFFTNKYLKYCLNFFHGKFTCCCHHPKFFLVYVSILISIKDSEGQICFLLPIKITLSVHIFKIFMQVWILYQNNEVFFCNLQIITLLSALSLQLLQL